MRTNILIIPAFAMVLAIALTSCGEHSLDEFFDLSSSSVAANKPSSSGGANQSSSAVASSSSSVIVINDSNIEPAANFASNFFTYISFPFIEYYDWISIQDNNYGDYDGKFNELDNFIRWKEDEDGDAFSAIFKLLYEKRLEYLRNGKFQRYIELISNRILRQTYFDNGWDAIVRQLLIAYEDLSAKPGSFSQIYEKMSGPCGYDEYEGEYYEYYCSATHYYDYILQFMSDDNLNAFVLQEDVVYFDAGKVNVSAVVWAYSFWGRRYNENQSSIETIATILRKLRDEWFKE